MTNSSQNKHIYGLDILRVISALAVMSYHFAFRGQAAGELPAIFISDFLKSVAKYGYLGVSIFFIISGFVISYSAEGQKPSDFLVSRFARVYPTFLIIMSVTAAVMMFSSNPLFQIGLSQYAANVFIFSLVLGEPFVDGVYWSIVLEVVFYGWVFVLIALGQFQNILRIIPFWIAFSFLNEFYVGSTHLQNLFITEYCGFFSMGIVFHRLRREFSYYGIALFMCAAAFSIYTSLSGATWFEDTYSVALSRPVITTIVVVSIAAFIFLTRLSISARYWSVLGILGGATYSFYLVHQNIGYIAITELLDVVPPFSALTMASTGLVAFSILFHLAVERRLNPTIKKRLLLLMAKPNRATY
ncbi:acyltransferase family protein [Pararhizobium sp. PWRC1-1]|uniref:acyltransferase family protein n=1 Tax=Pararhizobium sp. PWRC1-1 TaxID=2804566 RepID=UPI003CE8D721